MNPELPLRDIHAAVAAPWWPLAPAAWVVLALIVAALTVVLWWLSVRAARQRRRRELLIDLAAIRNRLSEHNDRTRVLREVSEWLRRLLRHKGTPVQVAATATSGEHWQRTLLAPFRDPAEHRAAAQALSEQLWSTSPQFNEDQIFALARDWVDYLARQRVV